MMNVPFPYQAIWCLTFVIAVYQYIRAACSDSTLSTNPNKSTAPVTLTIPLHVNISLQPTEGKWIALCF